MNIEKNDVPAERQTQKDYYCEIVDNGGKLNVLFVGNSITFHGEKHDIGWFNNWGMAASAKENDYVHVTVKLLEEKFGKINYCVANCGKWEINYFDEHIIDNWQAPRDFGADVVIIRLGENSVHAKDKFSEVPYAERYAEMVKFFAVKPTAKIITTGMFWRHDYLSKEIEKAAKENGFIYVPLEDLGDKEENMAIGQFEHKGVAMHPNDLGMRRIAERIFNAVK